MIIIRNFIATDTESVQLIYTACTRELREVYAPKPNPKDQLLNGIGTNLRIVALDDSGNVIGVTEYIPQSLFLYVQGIAVAQTHRRRRVASALIEYTAKLAVELGLPALSLTTIKETGNVEVFKKLGFIEIEERISDRFVGIDGKSITEVNFWRNVP